MKKILLGILVFICFINVSAKDYGELELIPVGEKANVTTKSFFYHNFYYDSSSEQASYLNNNSVRFDGIKNLGTEERYVSITLGFFDEKKENIGVYYYCSSNDKEGSNYNIKIMSNESKSVIINITNDLLYKNNKVDDVKYITVMSENPNCNSGTNFDFVGKKAQYIDFKDTAKSDYKFFKYCFYVLILIVVILVLKFIFDYTINKNGRITDKILGIDQRDKRTNEEIKNEYYRRREEENLRNKKVEKKKEIVDISQEEGKTDLHNMYK